MSCLFYNCPFLWVKRNGQDRRLLALPTSVPTMSATDGTVKKLEKITLDKLDVLCDLFGCELTEILVYVPNSPPRIEFNEKGEPVKRLYYEEPAKPKKGKRRKRAK